MAGFRNVGDAGKDAGRDVSHRMAETAGQVQNQISGTFASLIERLKDAAGQRKQEAAERVSDIGQSIHEAGSQLKQREQDRPGEYVHAAGDQVDAMAAYLRDHDMDELIDTVTDAARAQPAVFLSAAFVGGIAAARFLRASAERRRQDAYAYDQPPESGAGEQGSSVAGGSAQPPTGPEAVAAERAAGPSEAAQPPRAQQGDVGEGENEPEIERGGQIRPSEPIEPTTRPPESDKPER